MADFLGKKYKLDKSDKFDEYMKALGVGLVTRKMGNAVSPTVELVKDGDKYILRTTSTFKNTEITFANGEEIDEETADGRKVKSLLTLDGNKLTQVQKGDKETTIIREWSEDALKTTLTVDDIVCTRDYKLVA
ncbi:fatty acid-binding protein [Neocloeon triangulifer]|uniref:fatty acid-binding protein n=1 Tax=Neocloeon triangulifer TaxID=2078957 RepID=UPI00286F9425|nr:fatty acid-binding protein [Neocloeon triangulifer]